jgi:HEAT repeat protein
MVEAGAESRSDMSGSDDAPASSSAAGSDGGPPASPPVEDVDEFTSRRQLLSSILQKGASDDALESAILHLAELHDHRALDALVALQTHPSAKVRRAVAEALPIVMVPADRSSSGVTALISLSVDEDAVVRDWATCSLGRTLAGDSHDLRAYYDSKEVRAALVARLDDTDPATRAEACAGLAFRGVEDVAEPLRRELARPDVGRVPVIAAEALGSPELLESLIALRGWWTRDPPLLERAIQACAPGVLGSGGEAQ